MHIPSVNEIKEDKPLPVYSHFGAFIKKRREELHITQENFARKIRMDRGHLSRIECGKPTLSFTN
ncbi:helix-turn-helix domain-containing protein [Mucilaginibacter sp. AW1-7]|uniref:helix-turn-helix domain-containing protein n=1 Tax=Mucilaginibacter sp. AW1-7 TaxID=3349874 RepID=UPI003F731DB1